MAKRSSAGNDNAPRVQLGPFWLWWRAEREGWCICWYDEDAGVDEDAQRRKRRTRRLATGIGGGRPDKPPKEAEDRLAEHYLAWQKPVEQRPDEALVENIMADWLLKHAAKNLADAPRYAGSIKLWQHFFLEERRAGRLTTAPYVSDVKRALVDRFIDWRRAQRVSNHTISRDIAALRQPLNWAWKNEIIAAAPFVPDVTGKEEPRALVYTAEQVAALLEAAWSDPERQHVVPFVILMLSTHARVEAALELDASLGQIRDDRIYFNRPGRQQTKKRRSIVPVAPTLKPWLPGAGRVILWNKRAGIDPDSGLMTYTPTPVASIDNSFRKSLIAAGICEHACDPDGEPVWLPARKKLGETAPRPKIVAVGSPNTLRHTCSTEMHRRGVPDAQIDTAAGHLGEGTNKRHYRHLRPEYLRDFVEAVEAYWTDVGQFTKVHLRSQCDPKVVDFGRARGKRK